MDRPQYTIREGTDSDHAFVFSSYLNSYRPFVDMSTGRYYSAYHELMERCLGAQRLVVACSDIDPDMILGWALGDKDKLTYAYVKQVFRSLGIGKDLALTLLEGGEGPIKISHDTPKGETLVAAIIEATGRAVS